MYHAKIANLKVTVITCGISCRTDCGDKLTASYGLTLRNKERAAMRVNGLVAVHVVDLDKIAVSVGIPACRNDNAVTACIDVRSAWSCNIETLVVAVADERVADITAVYRPSELTASGKHG